MKSGSDHRELHDLLLEDRHAERALEHLSHTFARIGHRLQAPPAAQIRVHHAALDGAGPHDRDLDDEIEEALGREPRQHRHLRARLDLEDADRVGALDHRVRFRVPVRYVGHPERRVPPGADHLECAADRRQHAERQHVDLQQSKRLEIVLVPLDHAALRHRRVLDRHQALERPAGDDEPAGVLGEVPREADQRIHDLAELPDDRARRVEAVGGELVRVDPPVIPPGARFREAVDLHRIEAERFADVADRALRAIGDHRGGDRRPVAAVLRIDVLDDLFASLMLEVDVDVGRLVPLAREEALEEHRHPGRIDLGDPERVAHRRVGRRAAPLAEDLALAREPDDVVDGEKKGLVGEIGDQRELALDELADVAGHAAGKAPGKAFHGELAQPRRGRLARRYQLLRILVAKLVER